MALVAHPAEFDVMLTENMFGDILSDQAGGVVGSLGMLASASIGGKVGLYEPVHGSAPDIAGRGIANPLGAILSTAMLLRHSFQLEAEAQCIEAAVAAVLNEGCRTADLARTGTNAQHFADGEESCRSREDCNPQSPRAPADSTALSRLPHYLPS